MEYRIDSCQCVTSGCHWGSGTGKGILEPEGCICRTSVSGDQTSNEI